MGIFEQDGCRMAGGERAALEGVLAQLAPALSITVSREQEMSLDRVATHSREVHAFVAARSAKPSANVTVHAGDPTASLPGVLADLADAERVVDFVLVVGRGHADSARAVVEHLLNSPAVADTVILIQDTADTAVRASLGDIPYAAWPKLAHVNLDFVPGAVLEDETPGLGLLVVNAARKAYFAEAVTPPRVRVDRSRPDDNSAEAMSRSGGDALAREGELTELIEHLQGEVIRLSSVCAHHEALWRNMMDSASWRVTAPLRSAWHRRPSRSADGSDRPTHVD